MKLAKFALPVAGFFYLIAPSRAEEPIKEVPLNPQPGAYDVGEYRYLLGKVVTNDGQTTDVGSLFKAGLPVAGSDYFRLELPIGSFIWYPAKEGDNASGSIRIDPNRKYSQWSMALLESKPDPKAKVWRTVMRDPIPAPRPKVDFGPPAKPDPPRSQ